LDAIETVVQARTVEYERRRGSLYIPAQVEVGFERGHERASAVGLDEALQVPADQLTT
jgi:hypothetical protein